MSRTEIGGLVFIVVVAFTLPIVMYLLMRIWDFFVDAVFQTRPDPRWNKISATISLVFPVFLLLCCVQMAFDRFKKWWIESPFVVTALGLIFFGIVPFLLGRAILHIWRPRGARSRC